MISSNFNEQDIIEKIRENILVQYKEDEVESISVSDFELDDLQYEKDEDVDGNKLYKYEGSGDVTCYVYVKEVGGGMKTHELKEKVYVDVSEYSLGEYEEMLEKGMEMFTRSIEEDNVGIVYGVNGKELKSGKGIKIHIG